MLFLFGATPQCYAVIGENLACLGSPSVSGAGASSGARGPVKETDGDRQGQRQTKQRQTATDKRRDRQRQTATDTDREGQTGRDRHIGRQRQRQTDRHGSQAHRQKTHHVTPMSTTIKHQGELYESSKEQHESSKEQQPIVFDLTYSAPLVDWNPRRGSKHSTKARLSLMQEFKASAVAPLQSKSQQLHPPGLSIE